MLLLSFKSLIGRTLTYEVDENNYENITIGTIKEELFKKISAEDETVKDLDIIFNGDIVKDEETLKDICVRAKVDSLRKLDGIFHIVVKRKPDNTVNTQSEPKRSFPPHLKALGYNRRTNKFRGYPLPPKDSVVDDVIKEMRNIKPSKLTSKDIGYVRFYQDKYTQKEEQSANQGKWLLCFPSGSKKIDQAWELLVDCVAKDELDEIKVFPSTNEGEFVGQQTICVYNYNVNDRKAVVAVYERLKKLGLVDLHLQEAMNQNVIKYKSDQQTRRNEYGSEAYLYANQDIETLKKQIEIEDAVNKLKTCLEELFVDSILSEDKTAKSKKKDIINYLKDRNYEQLSKDFTFSKDGKAKKALDHLIILKDIVDRSLDANDIVTIQEKLNKFAQVLEEKETLIKDAPNAKSARHWKILKAIITVFTAGLAGIGFAVHAYKTTGSINFLFKGKHQRLREKLAEKTEKARKTL